MKNKYIVTLADEHVFGGRIFVLAQCNGMYTTCPDAIELTPHTEPDLERVRKEAYEEGYKKCLSELKEEGMRVVQNTRKTI